MAPQEVQQMTNNLVAATEAEAIRLGEQTEAATGELAPGLSTGSNAPGGYNYARNIAPVVDPLTTGLVVQAQQSILRDGMRDAQYNAQKAYEDAQFAYRDRQRAYQAEQARRNTVRRQQAEAAAAAAAQAQIAALRAQNSIPTRTTPGTTVSVPNPGNASNPRTVINSAPQVIRLNTGGLRFQ